MRIRIRQEMAYAYDPPARSILQILRVTPRAHEAQHVINWRIDIDVDCRLRAGEDGFGNLTHSFSAEGPINQMCIAFEGEVETLDTAGVVRGSLERFPPQLYLRETLFTAATDGMRDYADGIVNPDLPVLDNAHCLLGGMKELFQFAPSEAPAPAQPLGDVFAAKRGDARDLARAYIAMARHANLPARYVSGFVQSPELDGDLALPHGWAEIFVEGLGWVGFDPALGRCASDTHVRIACGLDHLDASPARFTNTGGLASIATRAVTNSRRLRG
jgi:transglutaminase-like putative cysteine protease